MRLGWRSRMGWRSRGETRLPKTTFEGDVSIPASDLELLGTLYVSGSGHSIEGDLGLVGDVTMQTGYQLFIDNATDQAAPPLAFRGDVDNGLAYVSSNSWRTIAGGANGATYATGAQSQNGSMTVGSTFTAQGLVATSNDISPAAWSGSQTDYNPAGFSTCSVLRIDSGGAGRVLNSLAAGVDGRVVTVINVGANAFSLLHDDGATGTAAQRFLCPGSASLSIPVNGARQIYYDATSARWRALGAVA